jgi:hypothetical protein
MAARPFTSMNRVSIGSITISEGALREIKSNPRVSPVGQTRGAKAEMVLATIRKQTGEFRLADIEAACPGVGREWIRSLLGDLRRSGEVKCSGKGPGARWRYDR